MKLIDLSERTRPVRLGYRYGIEMPYARSSDWLKLQNFKLTLSGLKYCEHGFNKSSEHRRWFGYYAGRKYRVCFQTEKERTWALLNLIK